MKIIEALKQIKELQRKADDLKEKVARHSAYLSNESSVYPNQKEQVGQWIQSHSDIIKEILRLRIAIQKTNLNTMVTIELGGKTVTKSIAEWVHRRRDLANNEALIWSKLTDRGLREGTIKQSTGQDAEVKIVRCYDPKERDSALYLYQGESSIVDSKLEVINAVTDLMEME